MIDLQYLYSYEQFEHRFAKQIKSKTEGFVMEPETYNSYLREGMNLINRVIGDFSPSSGKQLRDAIRDNIDEIVNALESSANTKNSSTWRKSRCALTTTLRSMNLEPLSRKVKAVSNPVPCNQRPGKAGRKQRNKNPTDQLYKEIVLERGNAGDYSSVAALVIAKKLGLRPAEFIRCDIVDQDNGADHPLLRGLKSDGTVDVRVYSAKSTRIGKVKKGWERSINRVLSVKADAELIEAINHWSVADIKDVRACQERVRRAAGKLSKKGFSFYSLRYLMGSRLKYKYRNSKNKAKIVAAALGHKSSKSASDYGWINFGTGSGADLPVPSQDTINKVDPSPNAHRLTPKVQESAPSGPE